jgi:hypothetical protein
MMHADLLDLLAAQLISAGNARAQVLRLLREEGEAHGFEVLWLRPGDEPDIWDVRIRVSALAALPSFEDAAPPRVEAVSPPFMSPAREAEPFVGDGTNDLPRLIAASDRRVVIPRRGAAAPGRPPPPLEERVRLRMLAGTIAGDALLSLQHQGREGDETAVQSALARARQHYAAEVERAGRPVEDTVLSHFDAAAARAARDLLGVC